MKSGKLSFLVFFITDFCFVLAITAVYSVFNFWSDSGRFRWFPILTTLFGFWIYYNTAGRIVMFFSETVVRFIRRVFFLLVVKPVRFVFGLISKMLKALYSITVKKLLQILRKTYLKYKTQRCLKMLGREVSFDLPEKKRAVHHVKLNKSRTKIKKQEAE